jgi:DeoR family transcriptional regulator of aga operon
MISVSTKTIVVSDSTKFGKVCLLHIAPIQDAGIIVTDSNVDRDYVNQIEELGTTVVIA